MRRVSPSLGGPEAEGDEFGGGKVGGPGEIRTAHRARGRSVAGTETETGAGTEAEAEAEAVAEAVAEAEAEAEAVASRPSLG